MNSTKYWVIGLVVALVVGFGFGHYAFQSGGATGVTITPYNALNNQSLVNELQTIANPLLSIEQTSTAALNFPALPTSTLAYSTTTAIGIPAALGDIVEVSPNTPTSTAIFNAYVSSASTTSATITIVEGLTGYVAVPVATTSFNITVLPFASFKSPTQANL